MAAAIGAFAPTSLLYRPRIITTTAPTTPTTTAPPKPTVSDYLLGRVPRPAPIPTTPPPPPPIKLIPPRIISDPVLPMMPTTTTTGTTTGGTTTTGTATGTQTGGTGTTDTSRLLDLVAGAFKPQEIGQTYGPQSVSSDAMAPSTGGTNPMAVVILAILVMAGVFLYANRKGKRAA